ncbi:MAG: hypothetical protein IT342_05030 [Candidatus Melainabacteria bacterium]|nr:hypothetical protein [Candidatus Melainabacteria bacterium]
MNAQAIPLTAGHSLNSVNYKNAEGARQLVQQNLQKRTNMRATGNNQPAATAIAKKSSTALKPMQMKNNEGKIACLMSFCNALLEVLGVVKA